MLKKILKVWTCLVLFIWLKLQHSETWFWPKIWNLVIFFFLLYCSFPLWVMLKCSAGTMAPIACFSAAILTLTPPFVFKLDFILAQCYSSCSSGFQPSFLLLSCFSVLHWAWPGQPGLFMSEDQPWFFFFFTWWKIQEVQWKVKIILKKSCLHNMSWFYL